MDLLTHGLLGASLSQTLAQKDRLRMASLAGFVGGILAGIDILVRSSDGPLHNSDIGGFRSG